MVEQLLEQVRNGAKRISFDRVPKKTFDSFRQLAKDDFCNDYGFALKHIMDFYEGILAKGTEPIEDALEALYVRVGVLEASIKKPEVIEEEKKKYNRLAPRKERG